ncbi:MAG: amidase [Alphaproteobacteria bacterium]|nr:amidase [Alphaproteobacteria bacterium]
MEPQIDELGAFVPGARAILEPTGTGPLNDIRLAVKDIFDIAGFITTCGNPDWTRTHAPSVATAPVVATLLRAGARLVGKTITVELAFGLTGENLWHGTPRNPRAPARFPGGSSAGSAAAVAGGLAELALGSDTGGSVRVPASYCGIFGIRPTQGAIGLAGTMPLAPSLDTPGWFTRSAELLARVGDLLLPGDGGRLGGPLLRVEEAWSNAHPAVARALAAAVERLQPLLGPALPIQAVPEGIAVLYSHFRAIQAQEAWASLGSWVTATRPNLSPAVAARVEAARLIADAEVQAAWGVRQRLQGRLRALLAGGAVLVYPTSPSPAPRLDATPQELEEVRAASIGVTAIGGLAGLPEVTLPVGRVPVEEGEAPVGLSLVAAPGCDRALLALAREAATLLGLS